MTRTELRVSELEAWADAVADGFEQANLGYELCVKELIEDEGREIYSVVYEFNHREPVGVWKALEDEIDEVWSDGITAVMMEEVLHPADEDEDGDYRTHFRLKFAPKYDHVPFIDDTGSEAGE